MRTEVHQLLEEARRGGSRRIRYQAPSEETQAAARAWAREGASLPSAPGSLRSRDGQQSEVVKGFEVWRARRDPNLVALREIGARRGAGVYVLRTGAAREVVVEVPHSFYDEHTLPIGEFLFHALDARALLVNTAHRYRGAGCEDAEARRTCPSDMAHAEGTIFQAVHEGLLEAVPRALVVAVHGFTRKPDEPEAIVSAAGTDANARCVRDGLVAHRMAEAGLYGDDVHRLGGLTGTQATHLRTIGGRMVHLELSDEVRARWPKDERALTTLANVLEQCLSHTTGGSMP